MKDLPLEHREKISIVVLLTSYARIYSLLRRDMERAAQTGANSGPVSGLDYGAALEHLVTQERFPYLRPLILAGAYSAEKDGGDAHPYGSLILAWQGFWMELGSMLPPKRDNVLYRPSSHERGPMWQNRRGLTFSSPILSSDLPFIQSHFLEDSVQIR
jgi:hypothetical protein